MIYTELPALYMLGLATVVACSMHVPDVGKGRERER